MDELVGSVILPGLPQEPGLYILWGSDNGHPMVAIVKASPRPDGFPGVAIWSGSRGAYLRSETMSLVGMPYEAYVGYSPWSFEALAAVERLLKDTR